MIEVKQLAAGAKVTEPGLYSDVDINRYHSDVTDGPGISSSGLRTIESKSPAHYYANSYLNPDREPDEPKDHFDFGKAAHFLLLGEVGFKEKFVVRPEKWSDWRTNDAKAWRAEQQLAGRTVLTDDQIHAIKGIAKSLAAEPLVASGILQGLVEHSMFWRDPKTSVWLKSRPDIVPSADGILIDLKTTGDASPDAIGRTVQDFGYNMQGGLASLGMKAVMGVEMTDFVLVWVEKTPPYAVNVSPVDQEWIFWGRRQLRRAIDRFAECIEKNDWPGYRGEITTCMPDWLRTRFEREDKNGLIPKEDAA